MSFAPMSAALRTLHERSGVRWADHDVPRNYGDPHAEYAAARAGAAVVHRVDRALLRVHGRDPLRMVQGLVTNDVIGAPADRAVYAALLTPKGRMVADVRVIRREGELWLECARSAVDDLAATLRKYVPPLFARFEDVGNAYAVLGVHGPTAAAVVAGALGADAAPRDPVEDALATAGLSDADGDVVAMRTTYSGDDGIDLVVPAGAAATVWAELTAAGARPLGHATLDVLRIEAGRPRWGAELTGETIPLEAGLLERAISTSKGCYTGQEVIIRILHRGHVNWHLCGVLLGDAPAPKPGTALLHPDTARRVARITSACASPRHRQTIALGYARRELTLPTELNLESDIGPLVTVVSLPFPLSDVGAPGGVGISS